MSSVWMGVLRNIFNTEVGGIDCVFQTETEVFTFSVNEGEAEERYVRLQKVIVYVDM